MIEHFNQLQVSPQVLRGLDKMGLSTPTQVQAEAIEPMIQGEDLMVQAPTGTGKTCAFGVPVIENADSGCRQIQTVVLCPTRELAIQTANVLKALSAFKPGIRVQAVYGGEPIGRQIGALRRKPQILVATPGRLMDHMQRRTVRLTQVEQIVLDEADRMLDMGFREDIDTILQSVPKDRQTVLFSATLSPGIKQIAASYLIDSKQIQIQAKTATVEQVEQFYGVVPKNLKMTALLELLQERQFGLSLVFVATKSMAETLAAQLSEKGFRAEALHGDLRQRQRDAVMDRYRKGKINLLVATDVAARGIDVHNIDAVINYDIPGDVESYIHRVGRTGRASQTGLAYTFVTTQEYGKLRGFMGATKVQMSKLTLETVKDAVPQQHDRRTGARPWQKKRQGYASRKPAHAARIGA